MTTDSDLRRSSQASRGRISRISKRAGHSRESYFRAGHGQGSDIWWAKWQADARDALLSGLRVRRVGERQVRSEAEHSAVRQAVLDGQPVPFVPLVVNAAIALISAGTGGHAVHDRARGTDIG
ncbi:hypothetical protein ACFXBB_23405 [Streptomyces scopuliridis]|uniref:hypothetical protein n=1 Tax=Streptomyces scopuliridis TaxID=452529 RepID=UPI00367B232E